MLLLKFILPVLLVLYYFDFGLDILHMSEKQFNRNIGTRKLNVKKGMIPFYYWLNKKNVFTLKTKLKMKNKIIYGAFAIFAMLIILASGSLWENNRAGFYQVKQAFFVGDLTVRNTPGTYGQWLGSIETYEMSADVFLSKDETDGGNKDEDLAERVLFPNGYADVNFVGMYEIALDPEVQVALHIRYNNDENVRYMVKQQIIEALKNTGTLMSAEEAYSYKRSDFTRLAREQALNGLYKASVTIDTVAAVGGGVQLIKRYDVAYDEKGDPIISKESLLKRYGISLPQFNVKDMDFDEKLIGLIDSRKDAQKAEQDAITAKAAGETLIAKEKATQEVDKIKLVTIAQKEKEVAELDAAKAYEVAKYAALQAKEEAKKIIAEGDANAAANRALVSAGLTPEQRMSMEIQIADKVSANIAKASTPAVVFMGSDKGSANEIMQVFGAERSLELIKKMEAKAK